MPQGKYLAGGLQSGCTANSTGVQYIFRQFLKAWIRAGNRGENVMKKGQILVGINLMGILLASGCGTKGEDADPAEYARMAGLNTVIAASMGSSGQPVSIEKETEDSAEPLIREATGEESTEEREVTEDSDIYSKPGGEGAAVGFAGKGTTVQAIDTGEDGEWCRIVYKGRVAYIPFHVLAEPVQAGGQGGAVPEETAAPTARPAARPIAGPVTSPTTAPTAEPATNPEVRLPEEQNPDQTPEPIAGPSEGQTPEPIVGPPEGENPNQTQEPVVGPPEGENPDQTQEPVVDPPEGQAPDQTQEPVVGPPEGQAPDQTQEPEGPSEPPAGNIPEEPGQIIGQPAEETAEPSAG